MKWTQEQITKARQRAYEADPDQMGLTDAAVSALMTRAVELAQARVVDDTDLEYLIREHVGPTDGRDAEAVRRAFHAQGATVATLQAKVEELEAYAKTMHATVARVEDERDALRAEVERLKAELELGAQIVQDCQAQIARLTAAGQVLSEHVDATAGEPLGDAP